MAKNNKKDMGVTEIEVTCPGCGKKLCYHNVPLSYHIVLGPEMTEAASRFVNASAKSKKVK